jgi:hypothetical protein
MSRYRKGTAWRLAPPPRLALEAVTFYLAPAEQQALRGIRGTAQPPAAVRHVGCYFSPNTAADRYDAAMNEPVIHIVYPGLRTLCGIHAFDDKGSTSRHHARHAKKH